MKPIHEQTILITGATDGLGRALALDLAGRGAEVWVHGRSDERGEKTLAEIRGEHPDARLHWVRADLAKLDEVRDLAAAMSGVPIDVLVSNAGIGSEDERQESADGFELHFAVNYLAGYLLTRSLLPTLTATARDGGEARIVMVSSLGQQAIEFDDVMLERGYSGMRAYCQSKLAQIMFAFDLADELAGTGVTANALHPATYMPTKMVAHPISTIAEGEGATARLAVDPDVEGVTGRFFDGLREARAHDQAYDAEARRRLRELSEELVG
ncbi:NAD(P)-dependent dehydrogenase (short-subunit alcohol dehydrogenase family) [Marmoricola sp. URHA0025 HA25]